MCSSVDGDTKDAFTTSDQFRATGNFLRCEELRVICGTRGDPGTVAPFRAWRGSRDLVAQSPKFHAPALARICRERREKSSTASPAQPECSASASSILFLKIIDSLTSFARGSGFWLRRCCRRCVRRLHLGWIHPIDFERARSVDLHDGLTLAHREMPHFLWHGHKIPHVHRYHFCFVESLAHARQKCSP